MSREPKLDIHQEITTRIIAAIEDGAGEFRLPWNRVLIPLDGAP
ncbi:MAG: DUF1738 domain-containing protein [Alphaproteobacteria bacterium]|nr:DUF1738 domain-containing protein [Alphaproteobacteria bacterium]